MNIIEKASQAVIQAMQLPSIEKGIIYRRFSPTDNIYMIKLCTGETMTAYDENEENNKELFDLMHPIWKATGKQMETIETGIHKFKIVTKSIN